MTANRYDSIVYSLLLLKRRNQSGNSCIDTSCVPVSTFNQLVSWGYIELIDGNSGLRITDKGENILSFNKKNAEKIKAYVG